MTETVVASPGGEGWTRAWAYWDAVGRSGVGCDDPHPSAGGSARGKFCGGGGQTVAMMFSRQFGPYH